MLVFLAGSTFVRCCHSATQDPRNFLRRPCNHSSPLSQYFLVATLSFLFLLSPFEIVFVKWSLAKEFICCDNLTFVIISCKICEKKIKILKFCSSYLILVAPRLLCVSRKAELLHLFLRWKACLREGVKKDLGRRKEQAPVVTIFTAQAQSQYCLNQKSTLQSCLWYLGNFNTPLLHWHRWKKERKEVGKRGGLLGCGTV